MMESLTVLLPTDFSEASDHALKMAEKISGAIPVKVHLLHVMQQSVDLNLDQDGNVFEDGEIDHTEYRQLRAQAEEEMQQIKSNQQLVVETHLKVGNITESIIEKAIELKADLVLMGSRGVYRKRGVFRGIETQYVVRKSPVPVLTVMCDRSELPFKHIVYVSDFEEKGMHHPDLIKKLQQAFGMTITLLHITRRSMNEKSRQTILQKMDAFAAHHQLAVESKELFADFNVTEGVNHFVQMHDADLICLGTHGRPGWFKIFWPSIAEHISTHVYKPVLTYHLSK
jgi:nucleotide-binding universal stress UspA family protein